MPKSCLVDSGVLVALLDPREEHHEWATEALLTASQPWLTCEAVFSEALFLLQVPHARALLKLVRCGQLQIAFNLADPLVTTTDADFLVYRRHGRQSIPCLMP